MAVKILWGSPLPPVRSGVCDYAVELLRPLSQIADVKILAPPADQESPALPPDLAGLLVPFDSAPNPEQLFLAHFGNNPYHQWIIDQCVQRRTVSVVHDLVLHHLLVHHTLNVGKDQNAFFEAMKQTYGDAGQALARARSIGLTGRLDPFLFPAFKAVVGRSEALICHSEFAQEALSKEIPDKPVLRMDLPAADPGILDRKAVRLKMGIPETAILMMHLGFLTPEKGLHAILRGLAAAREAGVDARLLLVGESPEDSDLMVTAERFGIESAVASTGWLPWEEMITAPAAADVGVVLRVPSAGETSAAVIRFLACGTPAAVIAQRQFLEWSEEVAPRITPGPSMEAEITRLLIQMAGDNDWGDRRSAARNTYESGHRPEQAAEFLVSSLEELGNH